MDPPAQDCAFDHVAIATRDLDEGAEWLRARLGVAPEPGGKHPQMGTQNRLLSSRGLSPMSAQIIRL